MNQRIELFVDKAQDNLAKAGEEDRELGSTVFYCTQALVWLLTGVLTELAEIQDTVKKS